VMGLSCTRSRRLATCGDATPGVIQVQVINLHLRDGLVMHP